MLRSVKSAVAAIALAAITIGPAAAAERFATMTGLEAEAMTMQEMGVVVGSHFLTIVPLVSPRPDGVPDAKLLNPIAGIAGGDGLTNAGNKLAATRAAAAIE